MVEWISVEVRVPEKEEKVLIWCKYRTTGRHTTEGCEVAKYCPLFKGWVGEKASSPGAIVKYWMPLPEAPKD